MENCKRWQITVNTKIVNMLFQTIAFFRFNIQSSDIRERVLLSILAHLDVNRFWLFYETTLPLASTAFLQ